VSLSWLWPLGRATSAGLTQLSWSGRMPAYHFFSVLKFGNDLKIEIDQK
jgi:hypothetical protein